MKKLLRAYSLQNEGEYYDMILDSYTNGQRVQAKEQMLAMPRAYRVEFVKNCIYYWDSVSNATSIYFFNILNGEVK